MTAVEGTGIDVPCCDAPRMWGGTAGLLPHTDEQHARTRRMHIRTVHHRLIRRAGTLTDHQVTIRFTASVAFFGCSCGISGPLRGHSWFARLDGEQHLYDAGRRALRRIRSCGPDDAGLWACHGDGAGTYCLIDGTLTDCDGQVIGMCNCPCDHGGQQ